MSGEPPEARRGMEDLSGRRADYPGGPLEEEHALPDPFAQFARWYHDAVAAEIFEPNAMVLLTVDSTGRPRGRNVLLRGLEDTFVFFTNYTSPKGDDIEANPQVGLVFSWLELSRQVRIQGRAERTPVAESDEYWATRPRESQLGAWASEQSTVIRGREVLEAAYAAAEARFAGGPVPRPEHWGGYRVLAGEFEFWQGRPNRLHDRLHYRPGAGGAWLMDRLAP